MARTLPGFSPRSSGRDLHAFPERNAVADIGGGFLGLGGIPGRVFVARAVHLQAVVMRLALPGAATGQGARLEQVPVETAGGEIGIALDGHDVVAFRENRVVPGGFHASDPSFVVSRSPASSASMRAARMKSLRCRPRMAWVWREIAA